MKYRFLGSSGVLVSRIGLGTLNFGAPEWGCDEAEARAILQTFVGGGGNFIDTANVYEGGTAEEIVGRFLREVPREQIVLASKACMPVGRQPNLFFLYNGFGASRKHILAAGAEVRQRRRHRRQHARADARKPGGSRLVNAAGGLGHHRGGDSAGRRQPHLV